MSTGFLPPICFVVVCGYSMSAWVRRYESPSKRIMRPWCTVRSMIAAAMFGSPNTRPQPLNPNSALELLQLLVTMSSNKQVRPDVVFCFALAETCFRQGGDRLLCRKMYRAVQT